jgi:hypothetical protein
MIQPFTNSFGRIYYSKAIVGRAFSQQVGDLASRALGFKATAQGLIEILPTFYSGRSSRIFGVAAGQRSMFAFSGNPRNLPHQHPVPALR